MYACMALALAPPRRGGQRPDPAAEDNAESPPSAKGWGQPIRDRVVASVREEVRERALGCLCALCGGPLPDTIPGRPEVCERCASPDAAPVYELAARLGIVRQCPVCGDWTANLLHHYATKGGEHPRTRLEPPRTSAWIFQLLNIEITTPQVRE